VGESGYDAYSGIMQKQSPPLAASVRSIGLAVPPCSVDQKNSAAFAQTMLFSRDLIAVGAPANRDRIQSSPSHRTSTNNADERGINALYRMSTVQSRGSVLLQGDAISPVASPLAQSFYPQAESPEERGPTTGERNQRFASEAVPLAQQAAEEALRQGNISPLEITHLIVVTCTGFQSPGLDVRLIETLGLPAQTERVQVGFMGCHAAINALRVARGLIAADPLSQVLIVCVELCTLHYQYGWETDRVVSNAIFADGAAAMVISNAESSELLPKIVATGSILIADSQDAMTWQIGDHGFEMTLSAEVPGIIQSELKAFLIPWLARHALTPEDIAGWAVHPGGPRILRSVQTSLQLSDDDLAASRRVLASHGNMSSPTMIFILDQFMKDQRDRPWLMLGFGPGLEVEVALIR